MGQYLLGTRAGLLGTRAGLSTLPSVFKNEGILFFGFWKKGESAILWVLKRGQWLFWVLKTPDNTDSLENSMGSRLLDVEKWDIDFFQFLKKERMGKDLSVFWKGWARTFFGFRKMRKKTFLRPKNCENPAQVPRKFPACLPYFNNWLLTLNKFCGKMFVPSYLSARNRL